jgi:hypothetical protein
MPLVSLLEASGHALELARAEHSRLAAMLAPLSYGTRPAALPPPPVVSDGASLDQYVSWLQRLDRELHALGRGQRRFREDARWICGQLRGYRPALAALAIDESALALLDRPELVTPAELHGLLEKLCEHAGWRTTGEKSTHV